MALEDRDIVEARPKPQPTPSASKKPTRDFWDNINPDYTGSIPTSRVMFHGPDGEAITWGDIIRDFPGISPNMTLDEWYANAGTADSIADDIYRQYFGDASPTMDGEQPDIGGGSSSSGGGGRSSGSSSTAAVYRPAPQGTLEDQIRSYVIATTGTGNKAVIDQALKVYNDADKQAFDQRDTAQIDPWQAMKEAVRSTAAYKAVNQGRPDSVDEMEWVSGMQAKLRQIGLSADKAEGLGIAGAIAGNTDEALTDAGELMQVQSTGRMLSSQRESLKRSAAAAARLVV